MNEVEHFIDFLLYNGFLQDIAYGDQLSMVLTIIQVMAWKDFVSFQKH